MPINSLQVVFVRASGVLLTFLANVVIARVFGATVFGDYSFYIAFVNILAVIGMIGLDTVAIREVAKFASAEDHETLRAFCTWAFFRVSWTTGFMGAGLFVGAFVMGGGVFEWAAVWVLGIILAYILMGTSVLIGLKRPSASQIPYYVVRPLAIIGLSFVVAFQSVQLDISHALILEVASGFLALCLFGVFLARLAPFGEYRSPARLSRDAWVRSGATVAVFTIIQIANAQVGVVFGGFFLNMAEVGVYSAAQRVAGGLAIVLAAVNTVAAPRFAELFQRGDLRALRNLAIRVARVAFVVSSLLSVFLFLFLDEVLSLFGTEFSTGGNALSVLIFGQLVNSFVGSVLFLLTMSGQEKQAVSAAVSAFVVNVSLCFVLLPYMGLMGAAFASAASMTIWNILLLMRVKRALKFLPTALSRLH